MNTEASETYYCESKESYHYGEHEDTLGELANYKQNKMARNFNDSQINLKSLSLSDTGALCQSSVSNADIDKSLGNISTVPKDLKHTENEKSSPSQGYHSNENLEIPNEIDEAEQNKNATLDITCYDSNLAPHNNTEEKISFLCFKWRKKTKQ